MIGQLWTAGEKVAFQCSHQSGEVKWAILTKISYITYVEGIILLNFITDP